MCIYIYIYVYIGGCSGNAESSPEDHRTLAAPSMGKQAVQARSPGIHQGLFRLKAPRKTTDTCCPIHGQTSCP